ncbi:hypothetical protein EPUS_03523 [Endocarpon pusillum Z07020]|uniref:PH domain-containing protein n=1 Tax=Endocarpon pusillum (strain Z07020 / HMAS-L-300199) TaxID=1263415 RepID=U1GE26_ENDPU|nr:uncharacterized protein EPUS_03523 [Endocarpon pusillum Z07020]ERF69971.1 hypothetical protein EPUS_03523 [Endocarpon pusillum Z07020]
MSQRPSHKRSKSALALSLLRGERAAKGDSGSESGSPITRTSSNSLLVPTANSGSSNPTSAVDGGTLSPISEPTESTASLETAEKVAPSGMQDHKTSIEDSVRTFRVFGILRNGDTAAISKALKEASSNKIPGTTILHLAIQCAEPHVVDYVLSNGGASDVNSRDKEGNTPLHLAAQLGRVPIVKQLLQQANVDESVVNHQGRMPIDVARTPEIFQDLQLARSLYVDSVVRQVHDFISHNDHRKLENLLVDPRVENVLDVNALELVTDPETMASGGTLLHEAARKKDISLIQVLLMHGADPFRRDRKGKLPQDVTKDDRTRAILKKSPAAAVAQRGIQEKAILGGIPGQKSHAGTPVESGKDSREMKGYLKKWTNYTGGYKLRWFVLEDGVLSYYKHQDDAGSACRGAINMRIAKLHMDPQDKTRFEIHGKSSVKYHLKANHVVEAKRWFWSLNNAIQYTKDEARADEKRKTKDAESLRQAKAEVSDRLRPDSEALSMASARPTTLAAPSLLTVGGPAGSRVSGAASFRTESAFGDDAGSNYGSYEPSLTAGDVGRVATNAERAADDFDEEQEDDDDRSSNHVQPVNKDAFNITAQSAKFQLDLLARVSDALSAERAKNPSMPISDPTVSQVISTYEAAVSSLDGLVVSLLKISRDRDAYWQYRLDKEADTRKMWEESMARIAQEHEELQKMVGESEEKRKRTKRALREALEGQSAAASQPASQPASRSGTLDRVQFAVALEDVPLNRDGRASVHRKSISSREGARRKSVIAQYTNISDSESGDDEEFFDAIDAGEVEIVAAPLSPPLPQAPPSDSASDEREVKRKQIVSSFAGYEDPVRTKLKMDADNRPRISLWGILKSMIGKDMTKMTLPVSFNEPTSLLQRIAEDMEYADLLDIAADRTDSAERMVYVAAFAASEYASTIGRVAKPFNPLLGETYEYVRPDKGYRFLIEQVSHHPPIGAAHAESANWDYFGESAVRSKFYGKTFDINHLGTWFLRLRPAHGGAPELYTWKKVTASVVGIITGNPTVDNYGPMEVKNWTTGEVCMLDFKQRGWKASSAYHVTGKVMDQGGNTKWSIGGRWNDKIYARPTPGFEDQDISRSVPVHGHGTDAAAAGNGKPTRGRPGSPST